MKKSLNKYNKKYFFENSRKNLKGLKSVNIAISHITKPYFKERNFKETLFFNNWGIIVGKKYELVSCPEKITKGPNLVVKVMPSYALEFEYEIPIFLNKIKEIYGYNPLKKIIVRQSDIENIEIDTSFNKSNTDTIDAKYDNINCELIVNDELRDVLNTLGRSIAKNILNNK